MERDLRPCHDRQVIDVDLEGTGLPGSIRLRRLSADDAVPFAEHVAADLERLSVFLAWPARTADPDGAAAFLGQYAAQEEGRVLIAGVEADGALVAGIVLFHHDPVQATVELGCWSTSVAEGKGVVRAACREGLRVARGPVGAERVEWRTDPLNTRSRALAERLGFRYEGRLRSSYVLRGDRHDTDLLSLVGDEIDAAIA
jgi:RimJ/RimL family protein N-acetyltransferase